MDNTQLPAEVVNTIIQQSKEYAKKLQWPSTWSTDRRGGAKEDAANDWQAGATEYATKLHQAEQERELWKKESIGKTEMLLESRVLLEKFLKKYDSLYEWKDGLYREIKTFLDGTK